MATSKDSPAHFYTSVPPSEKPDVGAQTIEPNPKGPANVSSRLRTTYLFPILHILWCILLVVCMLILLDGYHAILPEAPRYVDSQLRLRVSDVTTIISVALVVTRLLVGAWMGVVLWNVIFVLLETPGLHLSEVTQTFTYKVPPWHAIRGNKSGFFVVGLLLLVVPQPLIGPLISGAVDWDVGFKYSADLDQTQAGYPGASPLLWFWYYYSSEDRRSYVRRAAAYASIAWDGTAIDEGHCRHIMNDDGFPVNSSVLDATIPCLQIHSIKFPTEYPPDDVFQVVNLSVHAATYDDGLTRVKDPPLSYGIDGNAVLFDKDDRPGMLGNFPNKSDTEFRMDVPSAYLYSGILHAVVLINGTVSLNGNNCTDLKESIFGMKKFNNIFTPNERGNYYRCFTYAVVNLTAGVVRSPKSTYLSSRVIQGDATGSEVSIQPAPWVQEAMYLMPDVMSVFSMMNSSGLSTWENLEEYVTRLIRYSYQGSWDMLSRSFEPDNKLLSVRRYEQRQVAQVSRPRVFGWLGASLALTLSWALLVLGQKFSSRKIVEDGPAAALVTDCSPLFDAAENELTDISSASDAKDEKRMKLRKRHGRYSLSWVD
ncbi:hypothetical protein CDV31_002042 [Fusarium ambrosium]|uniref:Uncharacterized protein n=1 Tax=Fusarium ambrosium TaxID=131363 RepID=A0A428UXT5_9HYPO|nr:hypothetical protein CDV31_002042 [Fusarium ambrosium]